MSKRQHGISAPQQEDAEKPTDDVQFENAIFIGMDWADRSHAVCVFDGGRKQTQTVEHTPEAIAEWVGQVTHKADGRSILLAVEQSRGGLAHALMQYPQILLFPINPKQAARYREAFAGSGKKDDPTDAEMLARFVREHHHALRPWRPDDEATRKLGRLTELRRKTVDSRKKCVQQLGSTLKQYFPQALEITGELYRPEALELLRRWPTLQKLKRANPATLRKFYKQHGRRNEEKVEKLVKQIRKMMPLTTDPALIEPDALFVVMLVKQIEALNNCVEQFEQEIARQFAEHDDAAIFRSLPGAGAALAPRLLAAMGSDRDRFESAADVQCYSGIAPVTKSSGKSHRVTRRYACSKFLRQTFHEFADHARKWSAWSKAYYDSLKARGTRHNAALRALAYKWIRIVFRLWKDRTTYDEQHYQQQLKNKNVPYLKFLKTA